MLGQSDASGAHLSIADWDTAEAFARDVAAPLGVSIESLLAPASPPCSDDDAVGGPPDDEDAILWSACTEAMQGVEEQVVLLISCREAHKRALTFLGRLVGCVANAHVSSQVFHSQRGHVSVVLCGWTLDTIEADWSDEDPDVFRIAPLQ